MPFPGTVFLSPFKPQLFWYLRAEVLNRGVSKGNRPMLAIIAAILFAVAFLLRVTGTATDVVFSPTSLLYVGLCLLALHLAGVGSGWRWRR
jgi:hypothetical protein